MPVPVMLPEESMDALELLRLQLRLTKDLRDAARYISPQQQRILVDLYYQIQENRKRLANQVRHAQQEPNAWVTTMAGFMQQMEKLVAGALHISAKETAVGRWALSIVGIGPVIAAGLAAYVDITKTPSVSALWSLAGYNPTVQWKKGQKRPWNANLKVLGFKIGDSFCKLHNHKDCVYGHLYAARKQLEVQRNEAGMFRQLATRTLATRTFKDTETRLIYERGKLPAGRLELRARRVAVKRFLSHYFMVAYYEHFGTIPAKPWILTVQPEVHTHFQPPPGYETIFVWP
jgi:hypothetical protein